MATTTLRFIIEIIFESVTEIIFKIIQIAEFIFIIEFIIAEFIFIIVIIIIVIIENITGSDEGTAFRTASVLGFHLLFIDLAVAIGANHNHFLSLLALSSSLSVTILKNEEKSNQKCTFLRFFSYFFNASITRPEYSSMSVIPAAMAAFGNRLLSVHPGILLPSNT